MSVALLHRKDISRVFWEPYIITGYRKPDTSFWQCIKYFFVIHNDWGNFWTHFIPFWVWLFWLYRLSLSLNFADPFWYPLLTLWAGGCAYAFCSSLAHGFACKSLKCRQICFMIDYHGISLYGMGGGIAYYFYERPSGVHFFEYSRTFLALYMAIALNATLVCSLSRFYLERYRYILRAMAFALPYCFGCFPFFCRFTVCVLYGKECLSETLPLHFLAFFVSHVMAGFFVSKLPERLFPGKFDYFFQSHQLFHVMAVILTSLQFTIIPRDALIRYSYLSQNRQVVPTFYNTLAPFMFVFFAGFVIVGVFGYLVLKDILISNKLHNKKSM